MKDFEEIFMAPFPNTVIFKLREELESNEALGKLGPVTRANILGLACPIAEALQELENEVVYSEEARKIVSSDEFLDKFNIFVDEDEDETIVRETIRDIILDLC